MPKKRNNKGKIGVKAFSTQELNVVKRLTPFEDIVNLAGICSISLAGRKNIGALILKRKEDIQVKFCFDCRGIHPFLNPEQIIPIFEGIEGGLKEIPVNECMTIHMGSFTDDTERQQELRQVENNCDIDRLNLLIRSERLRTKELTNLGIRKNKFLRIWVTYSAPAFSAGKGNDLVENILATAHKKWLDFTGQIHTTTKKRVENIIQDSFTSGFQFWEQIISSKMGLNVNPLTSEEIWHTLYSQFNSRATPTIPNPLILDDKGLKEDINSDFHIRHHLIENENSIPFLDRCWIKIQNKFIGVLNFASKPAGWTEEFSQLRYLWELIAREKISNTEIVCQLTKANQNLAKVALQRITKQSITSSTISAESGSVDVKAGMNMEESIDAQKTILQGNSPVHVAVAFLVHRETPAKLDEACKYISNCFLRPAIVNRENEYAWKTWLQCCPFIWEPLLTKPFNRRLPYFSNEVPGLMPLIRTATGDNKGFELIASEGGTPVFIDLYNSHKNLGVFGTTRAGKSVLVAGILTRALAQNIPIVALDFPKPDGSSTFTDFTNFLEEEGAYFDISREFNNLFELPDLRGMSDEIIKERLTDFEEFLKSTMMLMVVGTNSTGVSPTTISNIESVLTLALKTFFNDDDIKMRYKQAIKAGIGTPAWEDTPTLKDFYVYCSPGFIKLDSIASDSKEIFEALNQVRIRLKFWLNSRVGQSISQPSTFRNDARLVVFALRNLSSESDAAILALSAYSAALRKALSSPKSIFFLDEAPILFQFESIAQLIGRLCANGAKAGIRVILSAQELDSIFQSKAASKIFANLTTRLIGRIQTPAVDSFVNRFKYPFEIISRNSTEAFFPKKEGIYSQWLLDDNGKLTFCRYYPPHCLLAAVANNPEEQELRTLYLNKYRRNQKLGMVKYTEDYIRLFRGEELSIEGKELLISKK
ncbi:MAG: hypothetical protein AAF063_24550 [Cyanobacteria bacterium J06643_5]